MLNDKPVKHEAHSESYCPVRATMAILGQKWTLMILLTLIDRSRRFNDIAAASGGINSKTLSDRLKELEEQGIVSRNVITTIPPWVEYSLTPKGKDLGSVIVCIDEWGRKWMTHDEVKRRS